MKYKVGDRVRIKSLDWYNENKDKEGNVPLNMNTNSKYNFIKIMLGLCGKVMTISRVNIYSYDMVEDNGEYFWTDEMIEGLSEEIERENEDKIFSEGYDQGYEDGQHDMNEWVLPEGFQFKDENGNLINAQKIVLEKKDNGYPKTYEECVEILGRSADVTYGYKKYVLHTLQMLLVCRDAYWQMAGQEMGLDDPWGPDWEDDHQYKYTIYTMGNKVIRHVGGYINAILAFPTEKMRDTFYENFKEEIEKCKELL